MKQDGKEQDLDLHKSTGWKLSAKNAIPKIKSLEKSWNLSECEMILVLFVFYNNFNSEWESKYQNAQIAWQMMM